MRTTNDDRGVPLTSVPGLADGDAGSLATDPVRPARAALRGIASIVTPTSIATSLVFYFGWARTSTQADVLGLHDSLLGYSTQDYILRSVDPMFWPLFVGVLTLLVAMAVHVRIAAWAGRAGGEDRRRGLLPWLVVAVGTCGVLSLALGTIGARAREPSRLSSLASPLCVTAGIVLVAYALHLRGRFLATQPAGPGPELRQLRLMSSSLMILLLLLSLFWSVSRYAQIKGVDLAQELEQGLPLRPDVSVYSAKRLRLQPPVVETDFGDDGSAYRFRYTGLKLLFRSDHRYFLQPADETGAGVNIVIADDQDLRFEFTRTGS